MLFKYMYNNQVCSSIDVDFETKKVSVINYTNDLLRRAFGKNENPIYEDFLAFIERRCIPRTRDKLKWHLESIGVNSYNPLLIITKTQGRMAEDHFWIDIPEKEQDKEQEEREAYDSI